MDQDTARILKKMAIESGLQDREVNSYLSEIGSFVPEISSPNVANPNDIVNPFRNEDTRVTQGMGENTRIYGPGGHKGVDLVNDTDRSVTNPIGGINVSGYQRGGYGNYNAVVGANPEELAQMKPGEIERIRQAIKQRINAGAESLNATNIPGKNISIQGHLAYPAPDVATVATGSANLRMGNTGRSTGAHLHQEFKNTNGQLEDLTKKRLEMYRNALYK